MRLFEEYLKRHNINDVPLVHHCDYGFVILRNSQSFANRWQIASIKWQHDDHHPGKYLFEVSSPIHDGYILDNIFTKTKPNLIRWDEYEDFILNWCENKKGFEAIIDPKEVVICAWEMFVMAYDGWFTRQPYEIKKILYEGLDKDKSIDYRFEYYQEIMVFLATQHPSVLRAWRYEVLSRTQNYSYWLAKIINQCNIHQSKS